MTHKILIGSGQISSLSATEEKLLRRPRCGPEWRVVRDQSVKSRRPGQGLSINGGWVAGAETAVTLICSPSTLASVGFLVCCTWERAGTMACNDSCPNHFPVTLLILVFKQQIWYPPHLHLLVQPSEVTWTLPPPLLAASQENYQQSRPQLTVHSLAPALQPSQSLIIGLDEKIRFWWSKQDTRLSQGPNPFIAQSETSPCLTCSAAPGCGSPTRTTKNYLSKNSRRDSSFIPCTSNTRQLLGYDNRKTQDVFGAALNMKEIGLILLTFNH